jgi:hypothetical protein
MVRVSDTSPDDPRRKRRAAARVDDLTAACRALRAARGGFSRSLESSTVDSPKARSISCYEISQPAALRRKGSVISRYEISEPPTDSIWRSTSTYWPGPRVPLAINQRNFNAGALAASLHSAGRQDVHALSSSPPRASLNRLNRVELMSRGAAACAQAAASRRTRPS